MVVEFIYKKFQLRAISSIISVNVEGYRSLAVRQIPVDRQGN